MTSANSIGNIMGKLGGLKSVSNRRKVMPEAEFLQDLEPVDTDVTGTAQKLPNFANLSPAAQNLPKEDLGGEITPQSYDVRANTVMPIEQEEGGFFSKLGKALGDYVNVETREKALTGFGNLMGSPQEQLNVPIETNPQEETDLLTQIGQGLHEDWSSLGNSLKQYVEPFGTEAHTYGEATPENKMVLENAQLQAKGLNPEVTRLENAELDSLTQDVLKRETDEAQKQPFTRVAYGATNAVANQPDLQAEFNKYTGLNFDDEIRDQTAAYEKVMNDIEKNINQEATGYTEQENRIKERILSNQSTESDKFYVGLALLMPLLLGAIYGKEAGLGALAGGAKGIADIYSRRSKENMENEELLSDIVSKKGENQLRKSELHLKRVQIPQEIKKNLPKDDKEFLKGHSEVKWIDPNTGEEKLGIQLKPNLVAYPEYVTDTHSRNEMTKEAAEITKAIVPTKEINKLTDEIIELSGKMKDKNILSQAMTSFISGKSPALATKLGEEVEFQGRKVNAYVALEHKIKLLVDAYRQAKGMRALTESVQTHIDGLFRNPAASFQSYADTIDQMLYTKDLAESRLLNTVSASGFAPEFISKDLQPQSQKTFGKLNQKSNEKRSSELLKE